MQEVAPPEASGSGVEEASPRVKIEVTQNGAAAAAAAAGSAPRSSAMFVDCTGDELEEDEQPRKRSRHNGPASGGAGAAAAGSQSGPLSDSLMLQLQSLASQRSDLAELLRSFVASRGDVNAAISEHRVKQEQQQP
jgi:hypothetical protein